METYRSVLLFWNAAIWLWIFFLSICLCWVSFTEKFLHFFASIILEGMFQAGKIAQVKAMVKMYLPDSRSLSSCLINPNKPVSCKRLLRKLAL